MELEQKVLSLIEEPLLKENIKVHKISYLKEEGNYFLRVIIDKDPYVDIDDCVKVSKIINPILDNVDLIEKTYILDVCSSEKGGHNDGC